jgi:K+-transporting ATPase KdpF subunit
MVAQRPHAPHCKRTGGFLVDPFLALGAVFAVGLMAYLVAALLKPEWFE